MFSYALDSEWHSGTNWVWEARFHYVVKRDISKHVKTTNHQSTHIQSCIPEIILKQITHIIQCYTYYNFTPNCQVKLITRLIYWNSTPSINSSAMILYLLSIDTHDASIIILIYVCTVAILCPQFLLACSIHCISHTCYL